MKLRLKLAILLGAIAGALLLTGAAFASDHPGPSYAKRGDQCTPGSPDLADRSGDIYTCEKRAGDSCHVWHAKSPRKGPWPTLTPCPCTSGSASASPTPSRTPTATPTPSHTATPSTTTPPPTGSASPAGGTVTDQPTQDASTTPVATTSPLPSLPVTGSPVVAIVSLAGALLTLGLLALLAARSRNRRTVGGAS